MVGNSMLAVVTFFFISIQLVSSQFVVPGLDHDHEHLHHHIHDHNLDQIKSDLEHWFSYHHGRDRQANGVTGPVASAITTTTTTKAIAGNQTTIANARGPPEPEIGNVWLNWVQALARERHREKRTTTINRQVPFRIQPQPVSFFGGADFSTVPLFDPTLINVLSTMPTHLSVISKISDDNPGLLPGFVQIDNCRYVRIIEPL